jgi:hypothetical protein
MAGTVGCMHVRTGVVQVILTPLCFSVAFRIILLPTSPKERGAEVRCRGRKGNLFRSFLPHQVQTIEMSSSSEKKLEQMVQTGLFGGGEGLVGG